MDAAAELGRDPVSKHHIQPDGTAEPISRHQVLSANADMEMFIFPVQLTTSRIGNLTRLIHTFAVCVTIHSSMVVALELYCL